MGRLYSIVQANICHCIKFGQVDNWWSSTEVQINSY